MKILANFFIIFVFFFSIVFVAFFIFRDILGSQCWTRLGNPCQLSGNSLQDAFILSFVISVLAILKIRDGKLSFKLFK